MRSIAAAGLLAAMLLAGSLYFTLRQMM